MNSSDQLRKEIENSGLKISAVMEALGIKSYTTMREKIDNIEKFTIREIQILCELLKISIEQREQIFFSQRTESDSVLKRA